MNIPELLHLVIDGRTDRDTLHGYVNECFTVHGTVAATAPAEVVPTTAPAVDPFQTVPVSGTVPTTFGTVPTTNVDTSAPPASEGAPPVLP